MSGYDSYIKLYIYLSNGFMFLCDILQLLDSTKLSLHETQLNIIFFILYWVFRVPFPSL